MQSTKRNVIHSTHMEDEMSEDITMKLLQTVTALETKLENLSSNVTEVKTDLAALRLAVAEESKENTKMIRMMWLALGAVVGAGGAEAIKSLAVVLHGGI